MYSLVDLAIKKAQEKLGKLEVVSVVTKSAEGFYKIGVGQKGRETRVNLLVDAPSFHVGDPITTETFEETMAVIAPRVTARR